jgi:hypothetical protein
MSKFVTRKEAVRLFSNIGLSEASFDRIASINKIEKRIPDGKQRGALYNLDQVNSVVKAHVERKQGKKRKTPNVSVRSHVTFRRMDIGDMPVVADILHELFEGYPDIPQWQERMRANPEIGYIVLDDDVIVGCGFIMPHTEERILAIFPLEATPITYPHEILPYEPGKHVCLYLRSVGVKQNNVPTEKRKVWAQVLIIGLLKEIVKLGSRGIIVDRIYGRSDTFQGERMLHRLGFTRLTTITSHENFVIDVEPSGITFVKQYKKELAKYISLHEGA